LLVLVTFVASFVLFLQTLAPSVATIFDDSLEFQLVAFQPGIAHPTGYPLYTLLGKAMTLLPIGTVAYRVNLLSALCGALAAALVSLIVAKVSHRRLAGLAAGLALAVSPIFWSQSTLAEVYTLNAFLIALTIYFAIRWEEVELQPDAPAAQKRKWFWLIALALGLGLTHHRSIIFMVPALLVFIILVNRRVLLQKKTIVGALACLLLPLLLYAYIPLRGSSLSSLDGSYQNTLTGFLKYVGGVSYDVFLTGNPMNQSRMLLTYGQLFRDQFGLVGLTLTLIGLVYLLIRWRRVGILTVIAFAGYTIFCISYRVADIEVFFIPSFLFLAIWVGFGLACLMDMVVKVVCWLMPRPLEQIDTPIAPGSQAREVWRPSADSIGNILAVAVPIAFLALLWVRVQGHYPYQDRSRDWKVHEYGVDMLQQPLERQATIIGLLGETTLLRYFQQAEDLRPDIVTVAADTEDDRRVAVKDNIERGKRVYLTRPLPGIASTYHLSAVGPLIRVQKRPGIVDVTPDFPSNVNLTNAIHFLGYDLAYPERQSQTIVRPTLFWEVAGHVPGNYKISARLYDKAGNLVGQTDAFPVHDAYPTNTWEPGEVVSDIYDIRLVTGVPPGPVRLVLVLYEPENGQEIARTEVGEITTTGSLSEPPVSDLDVGRVLRTNVLDGVELLGYSLPPESTVFEQGDRVPMNFLWRVRDGMGKNGFSRVWLDGAEASQVLPIPSLANTDGKPAGEGPVLLRQWVDFPLTARVPDGTYTLYTAGYPTEAEAQAGRTAAGIPLGKITVKGRTRVFDTPIMDTQVGAVLDRRVTLLGFDLDNRLHQPGQALPLTLYWRARSELDTSYSVFVHLVDENGTIQAQKDSVPHGGQWPTTGWAPGEVITDEHALTIPANTPPGTYRLIAGMYRADTGERLTAAAGNDAPLGNFIPLTRVTIEQNPPAPAN
jgi:hypothetical protein